MNEDGKSDDVGEIMVRPKFNFDIKREYLNSPEESKKVFLSSGWYVGVTTSLSKVLEQELTLNRTTRIITLCARTQVCHRRHG